MAMVMLFTGAAGLNYEYILSTVFTYLFGSSIEQFSITIGIMMLMMGVGAIVQKGIKSHLPEYFVLAELLLVLLGGFAPIVVQWAYVEFLADLGWIKFVYPGLIGLLIGVEIPLLTRINERFAKDLGTNIAGTWAWDYIGSAVGVVVWIWALHTFVPLNHLSFWVAAANLLVAVVAWLFFMGRGLMRFKWGGFVSLTATVFVVATVLCGYTQVEAWSKLISQRLYQDPIVVQVTTKFQNIVMTKSAHPNNPADYNYELFLNGNKQFASADEPVYHELLVHPAMNLAAAHRRVLILGGGDGLALREVLKYKGVEEVTLVDLDPGVIELAKTNPIMIRLNNNAFADARVHSSLSDPALNVGVVDTGKQRDVVMETGDRVVECDDEGICETVEVTQLVAKVNVFTVDADRFVTEKRGWWDVVIVDLPDPNSVELAKLYSQEFYSKIKRILSPDGIVVVQATSPYHAKETFLCIMRTMAAAGLGVTPYHENVPSFGDWGWVLGSPSLQSPLLRERARALESFSVPTTQIENLNRALIFNKSGLSSANTTVSTLMRPVVFDYYVYEAWKTD